MSKARFNEALLEFLRRSPTPFHAVARMRERLLAVGFEELAERAAWELADGGSYFVVRNDSSLVAFRMGRRGPVADGFRMVGAHTDSPCLRLKPNAAISASGYLKFGVEVYGGVLLNPWFDRDLSLAGRVTVKPRRGALRNCLVDFGRPIAIVPSLAIHLDREANDKREINRQTMLPPVLGLAGRGAFDLEALLARQLAAEHRGLAGARVLDFELSFYDTQPPAIVGLEGAFISGARLDNLLSCHTALTALADSKAATPQMVVCNDHEEIGSGSAAGARGNFLKSVLERIAGDGERYARMIAGSMLVSTDNAHALHPNFADKHDDRHGPLINGGPVIKVNSNQSYATNSETAGVFKQAAARARVKLQSFVVRSDMACGSTIGPLTAANLGVRTVDVGVPTFGMHSIREVAGTDDAHALYRALGAFLAEPDLDVATLAG